MDYTVLLCSCFQQMFSHSILYPVVTSFVAVPLPLCQGFLLIHSLRREQAFNQEHEENHEATKQLNQTSPPIKKIYFQRIDARTPCCFFNSLFQTHFLLLEKLRNQMKNVFFLECTRAVGLPFDKPSCTVKISFASGRGRMSAKSYSFFPMHT